MDSIYLRASGVNSCGGSASILPVLVSPRKSILWHDPIGMAHVAFDLDNTLGFFGITNKLGDLWTTQYITTPEQHNTGATISKRLEIKLARARETFAKSLLKDKDMLFTVLRPNLDALIKPLLDAKHAKKLKTVIIYSNTGSDYSLELAKYLIETHYKCRGFFSLMANHWHPLRDLDHVDTVLGQYKEPLKTIQTLQRLFKRATHSQAPVQLSKILLVDDRYVKHDLEKQESEGLTYLVPTRFVPPANDRQRQHILLLALYALNEQGLLTSNEYLDSPFCNRDIVYDHTRKLKIRGFGDLLDYVKMQIFGEERPDKKWRSDTPRLLSAMNKFLHQI